MKLSQVYSNMDAEFPPLRFNDGMNVIYAQVTRPKEDDKDSHNLGKTTLIHLLDFLLLKKITRGHFLHDHREAFRDFEFFLELKLNAGGYVTVKRAVTRSTKIFIKRHDAGKVSLVNLAESDWDYLGVPIDQAIKELNHILDLNVLGNYSYRKGISYFLRTQSDYLNVFQLHKFAHGRHAEWKPFISKLLGFDHDLVLSKYELDDELAEKQQFRQSYERRSGASLDQFDKTKGLIEIKRAEIADIRERADRFNFYAQEQRINTELVSEVETEVAQLNDRLYTINYEVKSIDEATRNPTNFDIDKVEQLFREAELNFPGQLRKSYEQLVEFNRKLSEERSQRLAVRRESLSQERGEIERRLESLDNRRAELLSTIHQQDWFKKFTAIQRDLARREAEVARLEGELEQIDIISRNERETQEVIEKRARTVNAIRDNINSGNPTYLSIRTKFNAVVKHVLELPALLSSTVNAEGNIEFEASIIEDETTRVYTGEGKGTSYRKLLCAAFDIALLETYADASFYRFVYHDGILEGLDNRKKMRFLNVVREFCGEFGLQYIMTVIDADLPRDEHDAKVQFPSETIVRTLHEGGDEGRLFRMPKF